VVIVDMPDNTAVASVAMAVGASGAISSIKTTFIPMEEAMRQAIGVGYRGPGG